jgi:hypothetical protein
MNSVLKNRTRRFPGLTLHQEVFCLLVSDPAEDGLGILVAPSEIWEMRAVIED